MWARRVLRWMPSVLEIVCSVKRLLDERDFFNQDICMILFGRPLRLLELDVATRAGFLR
jgi:hypothetical protein